MTGLIRRPDSPFFAARALMRLGTALLLALSVPLLLPTAALAQHHDGGPHGGGFHGGGWHGGGHGGGWHGGGWHWGVGIGLGAPLFWGQPYGWGWPYGIYDYPPPVTYAYPAPVTVLQQPAPAPAGYWYYCDNPRGYYPYVQNCNGAWRPVSITPTAPPPP